MGSMEALDATLHYLFSSERGLLAFDDHIGTMTDRLSAMGVRVNVDTRKRLRELVLGTNGLGEAISGVILGEDAFAAGPVECPNGVLAGARLDIGKAPLSHADGGSVGEGLDGIRERLIRCRQHGASFAKWRAAIHPTGLDPRTSYVNAQTLARFAAVCQEERVLPIVDIEVLSDGDHSAGITQAVTANVLRSVFSELWNLRVNPRHVALRTNMVVAGLGSAAQLTAEETARRSVKVFAANVPVEVPAIALVSGGQDLDAARRNLGAIQREAFACGLPQHVTFAFGRALLDRAVNTWEGDARKIRLAQATLVGDAQRTSTALLRTEAIA